VCACQCMWVYLCVSVLLLKIIKENFDIMSQSWNMRISVLILFLLLPHLAERDRERGLRPIGSLVLCKSTVNCEEALALKKKFVCNCKLGKLPILTELFIYLIPRRLLALSHSKMVCGWSHHRTNSATFTHSPNLSRAHKCVVSPKLFG